MAKAKDDIAPLTLGAAAALRGESLLDNPFLQAAYRRLGWSDLKPNEALQRWHMVESSLDRVDLGAIFRLRFPKVIEWRLGFRSADTPGYKPLPGEGGPVEVEYDENRETVVAKHEDDEGTPELRRQREMIKSQVREEGQSRTRPRTVDVLRSLQRNKYISFEQEMACRRFHKDFHIGRMDPALAADMGRAPGGASKSAYISDTKEDAAARVGRAIMRMGGVGTPLGAVTWHIIGESIEIKQYAERMALGKGKRVREDIIRGLVIAAAITLEEHYNEEDGNG